MRFYDLKNRKMFETSKYVVIKKRVRGKIRHFAVATAPSGIKAYRIIAKN